MFLRKLIPLATICLILTFTTSYGANLMQVFTQALQQDQLLAQAKTTQLGTQENVPIQGGELLPNLSATGNVDWASERSISELSDTTSNFSLNVTQPIFEYAKWANYFSAKDSSRSADATYGAALQDIIVRTATAYFNVLEAQDKLRLSRNNRHAFKVNLHEVKIRFNAGLAKTTDVDNAQAAYDGSLGGVIDAEDSLQEALANIQVITGRPVTQLAALHRQIPLVTPRPNNLSAWQQAVNDKNLTVIAARHKADALHELIAAQRAGHWPTLSAQGGYSHASNDGLHYAGGGNTNAQLTLSVPIFAGGTVLAKTRQSAYQYQNQLEITEQDLRKAKAAVQENYYNVINGIAKIKADRLTVTSNKRAVHSTKIAYEAGLSSINITSVVNAQKTLFQSEQTYAADKYTYILSLLKLKQAAGTLSVLDLTKINQWLAP